MKIVKVYTLKNRGSYATSEHWKTTRKQIHDAVQGCEWPEASGSFTIYPESEKRRGKRNGVKVIRDRFVHSLEVSGWTIEGKAKNALDERLGDLDAVLQGPNKPIVVEWEMGDIRSPHRSMNELTLLLKTQAISAGVLVVPSKRLCLHLPDRIGYIDEIEPYFAFWRSVRCHEGVLEIVVIELGDISRDTQNPKWSGEGERRRKEMPIGRTPSALPLSVFSHSALPCACASPEHWSTQESS